MQQGLAVEPHDGDRGRIDMLGVEESFNRLRVHSSDEGIGFGQHARPRYAVGQRSALLQGLT